MSVAALAEVVEPTQRVWFMFSANSLGWPGVHCLSQQVSSFINAIQIHHQVSNAFEACLQLFVG